MSPADKAVLHILRRTHEDPVFAWFMLGTESLSLLCEAHAARTGDADEKLRWPDTEDPRAELKERVAELEADLKRLDPTGEISAQMSLVDEGPVFGRHLLSGEEIVGSVLEALGRHANDPQRCVQEIAGLFDAVDLPIQLLRSA